MDGDGSAPQENTNPVPPVDSSRFLTATEHGSFATALEEAQDVHLTAEEGTTYLKNDLGVKSNTTDGTYLKTPNGDAQEVSKINEENWIPVIRHRCMQVKTKQGSTVGFGGRAGQSWRPQPGANLKKKKFPVTTDTTEQRNKNKKTQKSYKNHKESKYCHYKMVQASGHTDGYPQKGMPHYLISELEKITVKNFEIALDYWTNHLNFAGKITSMLVEDYPGVA
jgi:hypothetical protein